MSDPRRSITVLAVLDELERAGIKGEIEMRSKHMAIVWTDHGGRKSFVTACTPSDVRSHLNARSDVRRMIELAPVVEVDLLPTVAVQDGAAVTNTRDIAGHFEKRHDHVLRDIDNLLKNIDSPNLGNLFRLVMAPDGQGIHRRSYDMTRDGFSLLAMGFTGAKALKWKLAYISAFNTMEAAIRPALDSGPEMLALRGDLDALTDIVLSLPSQAPVKIKKPRFVRPSLVRKQRRFMELRA